MVVTLPPKNVSQGCRIGLGGLWHERCVSGAIHA
jgi:hypothetical protein